MANDGILTKWINTSIFEPPLKFKRVKPRYRERLVFFGFPYICVIFHFDASLLAGECKPCAWYWKPQGCRFWDYKSVEG